MQLCHMALAPLSAELSNVGRSQDEVEGKFHGDCAYGHPDRFCPMPACRSRTTRRWVSSPESDSVRRLVAARTISDTAMIWSSVTGSPLLLQPSSVGSLSFSATC